MNPMAESGREAIPQAVLSPLTRSALFLVMTIDPGSCSQVRALLPDLSGLQRAVGFRAPEGDLSCVTGIGSLAWDRLFSGPRPVELHPFRELVGPVHRAVATRGDLLFHIRAQRPDLCFALAAEIMDRLPKDQSRCRTRAPVVHVQVGSADSAGGDPDDDVLGFLQHRVRDFVDCH